MVEPKSFWMTMPGILSGVAAMLTAVVGAYLAFREPVPALVPDPTPIPRPVNNPVDPTPGPPASSIPAPDFPSGSLRVYSADFASWPLIQTDQGVIAREMGAYVLKPASNTWLGLGRMLEMTPLTGDFLFELRFRMLERSPGSSLMLELVGSGNDADGLLVYFTVEDPHPANYSIIKGRLKDNFYLLTEETLADRLPLPPDLQNRDWSAGNKLQLKRDGGTLYFFVNDAFVTQFPVPVAPLARLGLGAAFKSRVEITSIESRVRR